MSQLKLSLVGISIMVRRRIRCSACRLATLIAQSEPIRTAAEIEVKIVLPPLLNVALYHKIRAKVVALHTLGMSLAAIAKSLKINEKTARKAYYKGGKNELAI